MPSSRYALSKYRGFSQPAHNCVCQLIYGIVARQAVACKGMAAMSLGVPAPELGAETSRSNFMARKQWRSLELAHPITPFVGQFVLRVVGHREGCQSAQLDDNLGQGPDDVAVQ